jgi:ArsR family transcriptional regulator
MFYSLTRPELIDVLVSAEELLAVIGTKVSLCPSFGPNTERRGSTKNLENDDE